MELEVGEIKDSHLELGLSDDQVLDLYRKMLLTRIVDDRTWALNRQGRAPFVVSSSGHEAAQADDELLVGETVADLRRDALPTAGRHVADPDAHLSSPGVGAEVPLGTGRGRRGGGAGISFQPHAGRP